MKRYSERLTAKHLKDEVRARIVVHPPIVGAERSRDAVVLALVLGQLLADGYHHAFQRTGCVLPNVT